MLLMVLSLVALAVHADDPWMRPTSDGDPAIWGFQHGIRVGLPLPTVPRGLMCVFHSELGQPASQIINFIAVEPVVAGRRGYSEMERSALDDVQGMRLWAADTFSAKPPECRPAHQVPGRITTVAGVRALELFIYVEKFASGAQPIVRLRFYEGRPDEVELAVFGASGSAKMDRCVLSATCGNYARLRELRLKDRKVTAGELWPTFSGDGFAIPREFAADRLERLTTGDHYVEARPDEADPTAAKYAQGTPLFWRYVGKPAVQYWRRPNVDPKPEGLRCRVNGRTCYYGTKSPLPGGVAFENFELDEAFQPGAPQVFGVKPLSQSPQAERAR
jgi:hypothetical protein